MSAEAQTMYMTADWWDSATMLNTSDNLQITGNISTNTYCSNCNRWGCMCWTPYYTTQYWWPTYHTTKVRLTLTEVEHLGKLAANDRKLRETMRKFAPHIEVEVDFPGDEGGA